MYTHVYTCIHTCSYAFQYNDGLAKTSDLNVAVGRHFFTVAPVFKPLFLPCCDLCGRYVRQGERLYVEFDLAPGL